MDFLQRLREQNINRAGDWAHTDKADQWSPTDWGCALAGEVGELCNLLKKARRGEEVKLKDMAREIADVLTYLDILAFHLGVDLRTATAAKFNEVSERIGSSVRLYPSDD